MRGSLRCALWSAITLSAALGAFATAVELHAADAPARPNIIVVIADDQGFGELSCHGNPVLKTPHLDRLHDESVRLTDFHAAPMCTPTRGQLLTGVDCLRNLAMNVSSGRTLLRRDLPTMGSLFAAAGYATGQFGKWHVGDNYPYRPQDRGFQESVWYPSSHIGSAPDYWDNDYFDDTYWHNGHREEFTGYTTDVFFDEAMRWMRAQGQTGAPFLCYLATAAPHGPHFVPARYREAMEAAAAQADLPNLAPGAREQLIRYLAMIANFDENMGRLEAFLREAGLRENTILVYLTDNGSTFGPRYFNAGMRGGKVTLWEGGHRVPCFIRWPAGGLRAPGEVSGLTEVQDLLPTLLDLAGVAAPAEAKFDGTSLADTLRAEAEPPDRTLVVQFSRMDHPEPQQGDACVMWQRWRLVSDKELHDLDADPAQERNVIAEHPEIAARLREHYAAWWEGVAPGINEPQRVTIGHASEPESLLSPCDWHDVFLDQGAQVRRGERRNGVWHLDVARPGEYRFELRRWPRERGAALSAGLPPQKVADGEFPASVALSIARARLEVGAFGKVVDVAADAASVVFRVPLEAGPTELKTWFYDAAGQELCGAYYVYVKRMPDQPEQHPAAQSRGSKPNIVFILADDLGWGDLGCYGSRAIQTPRLDQLAAEGTRFTDCYSGSCVCAPTRCVLMTGLHPGHCRRRDNTAKAHLDDFAGRPLVPLSASDLTFVTLLARAGYVTAGFGKWGLGNPGTTGTPDLHGFRHFYGYLDQVHAHDYYTAELWRDGRMVPLAGNANGQQQTYSHDVIAAAALEFLRDQGEQPFFLYLPFTLPHGKHVVPDQGPYRDKPWPEQVKNYAAMVTRLDHTVGQVLDELERRQLAENTIVFFSSDNGPTQPFADEIDSNGPWRGTKLQLYEAGIRCPMIVRWPGRVPPGAVSDYAWTHKDLFATVCDLAGLEPPPGLDSISVLPTLLGDNQPPQPHLYWEVYSPFQQSVRMGTWKGIRFGTAEPLELYDLARDPGETQDLAAARPEIVARIRQAMAAEHVEDQYWPAPERRQVRRGRAAAAE